MRRSTAAGWIVAIAALIADRVSKAWMFGVVDVEGGTRKAVTPFLDLVMVWNRGVSYGLLSGDGELGRWLLAGLGVAGSLLFAWWLASTRRMLPALALGLVIGGALSNVIDRVVYGAVADFLLLHYGAFEWYVFNVADVFIVAGAIGLVVAWLTEKPDGRRADGTRPEKATDA